MTWFLAQTKISQEERAYRHLLNQGFDVYLPRHEVIRAGRVTQEPVFRRYVFIQPSTRARLCSVHSTRGCQDVVYFGEAAAQVPSQVIDELRRRERDGFLPKRVPIHTGDEARVIEGPLDQLRGVYEGDAGKGQGYLLVELFGRAITIKINKDWLESLVLR